MHYFSCYYYFRYVSPPPPTCIAGSCVKQCFCFIWIGEVMVVKFIMEKPLWLEHQLHCPKNNLGCGLKTDPVMQRFVSGVLTHISGTKTFASAPTVTDSFFLRSFRFIFGTVYNWEGSQRHKRELFR